jgi:tetratricopeptide (TPR) repeat protein
MTWLKLTGMKFWRFWNWYEVPDNQNYYFFSRYSLLQRLPLPNFHLIAALGLAGMLFLLPQWKKLFLLYMTAAIYSFTVIAFYVFERYRLPVVPPLILFGSFLLCEAADWRRQKKWKPIAGASAAFILLFFLIGMDINKNDYYGDSANAYCRLGAVHEANRNWDAALAAYRQAIEVMPYSWTAYYGLGQVHSKKKQRDLALENYLLARMYNPGNPDICARIGFLYYRKGDLEKSLKFYRFAAELKPDWQRPHYWLALIYKDLGDLKRAETHMNRFKELRLTGGVP